MRVVVPYNITDDTLSSSTVPETDYAAWSSGTAYAVGDRVIRVSTHCIYEALTANTGQTPEAHPTDWLDLGATNRWRPFDKKVGTRATATTSMAYEFTPGRVVSGLALLETAARSVRVIMTDVVDGVVYDSTFVLEQTIDAPDWWNYFFDPFRRRSTLLVDDLPMYRDAQISVAIAGAPGETVSCGVLVIGQTVRFAEAVLLGASLGIQDYSRKDTDDWGNTVIVERTFAKRATWALVIGNEQVDTFMSTMQLLRAMPAVYVGSGRHDAMVVYGFPQDFGVEISYPQYSNCSIELIGLT